MNSFRWIFELLIILVALYFGFVAMRDGFKPEHIAAFLFGVLAAIDLFFRPPAFFASYFRPRYANKRMTGKHSFDYKLNDGNFDIGEGEYIFKTHWSSASENSIHTSSIYMDVVVLLDDYNEFTQVRDAKYEIERVTTSREITPKEGQFFLARNNYGHYALIRVVDVKYKGRAGDTNNLVEIVWIINPDRKTDFS